MGIPFMVLFDYKMDFARKLLDSGSYNVNEVGFKIGYSTGSHFIAAFKRNLLQRQKKIFNVNQPKYAVNKN
jgi:AraC-like DNA-binding protein